MKAGVIAACVMEGRPPGRAALAGMEVRGARAGQTPPAMKLPARSNMPARAV